MPFSDSPRVLASVAGIAVLCVVIGGAAYWVSSSENFAIVAFFGCLIGSPIAVLEHKQKRAWAMASEQNASLIAGNACQVVSSNGAARTGTKATQGSMRGTKFQGTAGYVTRMSGGVGGRGREASSYPD